MTTIQEKLEQLFPKEDSIPEKVRLPFPLDQREYLVNGELRSWEGPVREVYSPMYLRQGSQFSQILLGRFPLLKETDVMEVLNAAIQAYNNGQGLWPTMSVRDRIRHVEQFVYGMRDRKQEVVNLLLWEIGKSYEDSEKEFDRTIDYILATIEALKDLDRISSRFTIEQGIIGQIRRAPLGVVLCMGPFNYPLNETFTTLIPALIMGNTIIFKPPRMGVLLHRPLLEIFREVFPKGVVNAVYGAGQQIIAPLMTSGKIDVLAFIGSSRVADIIKKQHPKPHRMRSILGLDAKNPGIILPDADLESTVKEILLGTLSFNGQRCTALKILFVHKNIVGSFLERFSQAVNELPIGMPWEPKVTITPLPEMSRIDYMNELVLDARTHGARIVNDGGGTSVMTLFYPAVVYPVNDSMRLYAEEQFGPVIPVVPFEDIEDPIRYVVESDFGQQVSLFGSDPDVLAQLVDPLVNQVCRVNLNSQCQRGPDTFPFTGRKDSAEGTLSVSDALRVFSIRTLVAAKQTDLNKQVLTTIVREHKSNFLSTDFIL